MNSTFTHRVTYRGHSIDCNEANYSEVCEELIAKHGPSNIREFPRVEPLNPTPFKATPEVKGGELDVVAQARIAGQAELALTAGFAPKPPVYAAGTRVVEIGVENALQMQLDHDEKPTAVSLAQDLERQVLAEQRKDLPAVRVSTLRMSKAGLVVLPDAQGEPGRGMALPVSERAFAGLFSRMPCRAGQAYLADCSTELRAINFNHWALELGRREEKEQIQTKAVLRTRMGSERPEAFATVSQSYTAFDTDKIAAALALAFPEDARGTVHYDGQRMRFEGLWRTNVAPDEFAAGEFFKAGVVVRADDTGAGSIRVQSVVWRNLCLNLIILDRAIGVDIRIRHLGSVEALAVRFREAFGAALASVDGFRKAWGYAVEERGDVLVAKTKAMAGDEVTGMSAYDLLPGLFNGIFERELVPVQGRRKEVIPKLLEMHRQDEAAGTYGVSRASIVNAFTRYAHRVELDPFAADEIREGAGALLSGHRGGAPRPLPYVAL